MSYYQRKLLCFALLVTSFSTCADWSATLTGVTDYSFNGVSQTNRNPALQGSVDYAADAGWYAGSWTSRVDYGDSADRELDFYVGHYLSLTDSVDADYGIAYYSYHGGDNASALNYPEAYGTLIFNNDLGVTEATLWYTWDYFGLGADHLIGKLAHTYSLADNHHIRVSVDVSKSLDTEKYAWDTDSSHFVHYKIAYETRFQGFDIEIAAEDTTMNYHNADARIVASLSRTFSF